MKHFMYLAPRGYVTGRRNSACTGQYLRQRIVNDDMLQNLPFQGATRIGGMHLQDELAGNAGARNRHHPERGKNEQADLPAS
ncbi:hypothetical protein ACXN5S_12070 [Pseudoroseicyclus sp. H15]